MNFFVPDAPDPEWSEKFYSQMIAVIRATYNDEVALDRRIYTIDTFLDNINTRYTQSGK